MLSPLEPILRAYIVPADRTPRAGLLFPSYRTGEAAVLTDFRTLVDAVATRVGWKAGEITSKMFRHTYCATRLQTLDDGPPVAVYTVAKELGHGGEAMVRRVYGHLGQVRHRAEAVEYQASQHRTVKHRGQPVREWLKALRHQERHRAVASAAPRV